MTIESRENRNIKTAITPQIYSSFQNCSTSRSRRQPSSCDSAPKNWLAALAYKKAADNIDNIFTMVLFIHLETRH